MRRRFSFGVAAIGFVVATRGATAQAVDPSTALAPTMWAAQTDPSSIRLAWDHVPGPTSYVVSCEIGGRAARQISAVDAPLLAAKSATAPARRMSAVLPIRETGVPHLCFLQWRFDPKGAPSARLPFNEVTPVASVSSSRTAPASVTARQTAVGEITLTWDAVPGATAYVIGRAVESGGFQLYCDLCSTRTTFVDRFTKAGMSHRYTVAALSPAGSSGKTTSNIVIATSDANAVATESNPSVDPTLKSPSTVTAVISGATSVQLSWNAVPGAAGYRLLRSVDGGALAPLTRLGAASGASVQYPDDLGSYLAAGSTQVVVRYAVQSLDANGNATAATSSNQVTLALKSGMPTGTSSANASNARATATSASAVTLTWSPPAGSVPCALERALSGGAFAALPAIAPGTARGLDAAPNLLAYRPRYRITCGVPKSPLPSVRFNDPTWPVTLSSDGAGASSSATQPTNLRASIASPDAVTLTWGPPTSAIACSLRRKSGSSGSYVTLRSLPIGTWQHVDTMSGLVAAKPQYQLACGDPKAATVVSFPTPR